MKSANEENGEVFFGSLLRDQPFEKVSRVVKSLGTQELNFFILMMEKKIFRLEKDIAALMFNFRQDRSVLLTQGFCPRTLTWNGYWLLTIKILTLSFCSTSMPLASTRWVPSTFSRPFPLSSKRCPWLTSKFSSEIFLGNAGNQTQGSWVLKQVCQPLFYIPTPLT